MQTDQHLYTLTRSEFAKEIGKSREAVKQDMRRGKYKQLYIFVDGKYKFKTERQCVKTRGQYPLEVYPSNKRKINRGGHESAIKKGRYPNQAFANHNTMKKFLSAKGKLTPEQLRLVPEIESKVLAEHQRLKVQDYESKLPPRETPGVHLEFTLQVYSMRVIVDIVTLTITMEEHTFNIPTSLKNLLEDQLRIKLIHTGNQNIIDIV